MGGEVGSDEVRQEEEEEEGVPSGCSSFSTSTVKSIMLALVVSVKAALAQAEGCFRREKENQTDLVSKIKQFSVCTSLIFITDSSC